MSYTWYLVAIAPLLALSAAFSGSETALFSLTPARRERLLRAESDGGYYAELVGACAARRQLFTPQQEYAGWEKLLVDIQSSAAV